MSCPEVVVFAFGTLEKSAQTAGLPDRMHAFAAAGQYFVWVSLMPDIPNQAVVRRIEYVVQRDSEFDGAQSRSQVPTSARYDIN